MSELIKYNIQTDGIVFIGLNRQPVNALSMELIEKLTKTIEKINNNSSARIVIIHSTHNNFSAGADLKERKIMSIKNSKGALDMLNNCFNLIDNISIPTIAAINGYCLGGGAELSLCCDFRILEESAIIGFPEVSIGIIPGAGGTQRLPRITNIATSKYWIYSARKFTAEEALEDGVADFISPDGELIETAIDLAEEIIANAPKSIIASKKAIKEGVEVSLKDGLNIEIDNYNTTLHTEDRNEALNAFSEKRKPIWKGE